MKLYKFPCGCEFPILKEYGDDRQPLVKIGIEDINKNCPAVWDIYAKGLTLGIFQFDTPLGKKWCKEVKPTTISHLQALGAILRPGVLNSKDENNISLTEHYARRKNRIEEVIVRFPEVEDILKSTFQIMVYQEDMMRIAERLAGFDPNQKEKLRKNISKKIAKEVYELGREFVECCKKAGRISEESANEIFGWMKAASRYLFPAAHAAQYGIKSYKTAYLKTHFPLHFYKSKLKSPGNKIDKQETVSDLVHEAKLFNINVKLPDLRRLRKTFHTDGKDIYFGLSNIQHIGPATLKYLRELLTNVKLDNLSFFEFCCLYALEIGEKTCIYLVEAGALDFYKLTRAEMIDKIKLIFQLTNTEAPRVKEFINIFNIKDFKTLFELASKLRKHGGLASSEKRSEFLRSCYREQEYHDNPLFIAFEEEKLLGVAVTYQKIDAYDTSLVNTTCKEFLTGRKTDFMVFGVDILSVREYITMSGDNEGRKRGDLFVTDGTAKLKITVWSDVYEKNQSLLTEGNSVIVRGERGKGRYSDNLVARQIEQAV